MQSLFLTYLVGGILVALLSLPLIAGKVRPNPFYGFRIPATLDDPDIWYAANRYFAKRERVVALIEVSAAVALYFLPGMNTDTYALSVLGMFIVAFWVAILQSWRYINSTRWAAQ